MLRRVLKKEIGIKDLFTATLIGHTFKFPDLLEGKSNFKFDMHLQLSNVKYVESPLKNIRTLPFLSN